MPLIADETKIWGLRENFHEVLVPHAEAVDGLFVIQTALPSGW